MECEAQTRGKVKALSRIARIPSDEAVFQAEVKINRRKHCFCPPCRFHSRVCIRAKLFGREQISRTSNFLRTNLRNWLACPNWCLLEQRNTTLGWCKFGWKFDEKEFDARLWSQTLCNCRHFDELCENHWCVVNDHWTMRKVAQT